MTGPEIPFAQLAILTLQGVAFAAFTYFAFQALFRLRRHALSVKRPHTGLASELVERQRADLVSFRDFAMASQFRTERRRLLALLVLLAALIVAQVAMTPKPGPPLEPATPFDPAKP